MPPAAGKRVYVTVGPGLIAGKRHMTQRSIITALAKHVDVFAVPVDAYDFGGGRVRAYRRVRHGGFEDTGLIEPRADLWIVYSDGYYLDHRALGFGRRSDFFRTLLEFHDRQCQAGAVQRIINPPEVEARTLKSWFTALDASREHVIPTRLASSLEEVHELLQAWGAIVAKLDWGGGGNGARRLMDEADVRRFAQELTGACDRSLADYCFQPYLPGDEKRLWFVGGRCVAGRVSHGRATPWSASAPDYEVQPYFHHTGEQFRADLAAAERLCRLSGLEIGSIDFIGDRINEINGCGTIFTEYRNWNCVVDARPALTRYVTDLAKAL